MLVIPMGNSHGAVKVLAIDSDRGAAFLPYSAAVIDKWETPTLAPPIPRPVCVYSPGLGSDSPAKYFSVYNGNMFLHAPAQIGLLTYPGKDPIWDRGLYMTVTDWRWIRDPGADSITVVGAGIKGDTLLAFKVTPGGPVTIQFLGTVSDRTGDGFWDGQIFVRGIADYDFDGISEAFLAVEAGKDLSPRQVVCVEIPTLKIEWRISVSSQQEGEIVSCADTNRPAMMFVTYAPGHGAIDSLFTDDFGYLCKVTGDGAIAFRYRIAGFGDHPKLIKIDRDSTWLLWHTFTIGDSAMANDSARSGQSYLTLLTSSGRLLKTITVKGKPSSLWIGPFESREKAIFALPTNGALVVLTPSLDSLAESSPSQLGNFIGEISCWPGEELVYAIGMGSTTGFYSTSMRRLAFLDSGVGSPELLEREGDTSITMLTSAPTDVKVIRIGKRSVLESLMILYLEYRVWILAGLMTVLIALIISNFYRHRAQTSLQIISRQKNELESTHRALAAAQEQIIAQEKYQQAQDIAGGLAHEIRNALFPVDGALIRQDKLLEHPEGSVEAIRASHQRIRAAISRAVRLTDRVTAYTKLDSQVTIQRVNLQEVLNTVLQANTSRLEQSGVRVESVSDGGTSVAISEDHLFSIFNNLLANSLDALPDAPSPRLVVRWSEASPVVRIDWFDNGCGMDVETQARAFDAFFSTKPTSGTGLGLAVIKRIVELYKGRISVSSEPNAGTTFQIELPIS